MKPATIKLRQDIYVRARQSMVETQLVARGIKQKEVLDAMLSVPRHWFVEECLYSQAYTDYPLPIGEKQTISQPYMVAFMSESLCLTGKEKVLEIGGGSGYHSAVLSMLASKVCSVERISTIAAKARKALDSLRCPNVVVRVADGTTGWPEEAPFDAIVVAAAAPQVPPAYIEQLSVNGRLVMPVGTEDSQRLIRVTKNENGIKTETLGGCRFVKLIGKFGWEKEKVLFEKT